MRIHATACDSPSHRWIQDTSPSSHASHFRPSGIFVTFTGDYKTEKNSRITPTDLEITAKLKLLQLWLRTALTGDDFARNLQKVGLSHSSKCRCSVGYSVSCFDNSIAVKSKSIIELLLVLSKNNVHAIWVAVQTFTSLFRIWTWDSGYFNNVGPQKE